MDPKIVNWKKRKSFGGDVEDLNLPALKHICCKAASGFEQDSVLDAEDCYARISKDDMDVLDSGVESGQDSNSYPEDSHSQLSVNHVKFDAGFWKTDSHDEASASWSNLGSGISKWESMIEGSTTACDAKEEIIFTEEDHYRCHCTEWHDTDIPEDCVSAENSSDCKQQTSVLEDFLSSSGMDPKIFLSPSERWSDDQETEIGIRKPTIDQEFEQYFSTLML